VIIYLPRTVTFYATRLLILQNPRGRACVPATHVLNCSPRRQKRRGCPAQGRARGVCGRANEQAARRGTPGVTVSRSLSKAMSRVAARLAPQPKLFLHDPVGEAEQHRLAL